tara:strand:+ start:13967 stop:14158 length:192 start_codon:yes stop_codon:yes gene_type:complete
LLLIIKAAITPGIHPKQVKMKTIIIDPHPLSITAKGGKMMHNRTLRQPILYFFNIVNVFSELF